MKPRRTVLSNRVYRLDGGTEDNDLWATYGLEDGDGTITSVWEPTDEERRQIAGGANIALTTWGSGTPPVALRTTKVQLGKAPDKEASIDA